MKTIWKFPMEIRDSQGVRMSKGARILCVQIQRGEPMLWAEVDEAAEEEVYTIYCHDTGHKVYDDATHYIGTVQLRGLVFHFYSEGVTS